MHKLHYTSVGPLERGPADGMGPLIRLGIKLLFIYSVDKMLPRLIVVGEGNIAECCHWWWLLCWPLYSAGDEYHYTPPSWCPDPSHTHNANAADLKMQTDLVWGSLELLAGFHDWNTNEKTESEERSAKQNQCSSTYNQATNTQSLET